MSVDYVHVETWTGSRSDMPSQPAGHTQQTTYILKYQRHNYYNYYTSPPTWHTKQNWLINSYTLSFCTDYDIILSCDGHGITLQLYSCSILHVSTMSLHMCMHVACTYVCVLMWSACWPSEERGMGVLSINFSMSVSRSSSSLCWVLIKSSSLSTLGGEGCGQYEGRGWGKSERWEGRREWKRCTIKIQGGLHCLVW